jgi:hypothetical protein
MRTHLYAKLPKGAWHKHFIKCGLREHFINISRTDSYQKYLMTIGYFLRRDLPQRFLLLDFLRRRTVLPPCCGDTIVEWASIVVLSPKLPSNPYLWSLRSISVTTRIRGTAPGGENRILSPIWNIHGRMLPII